MTQRIILNVPTEYILPQIYQLSEPRLVAQVLDLGANILLNLENQTTAISNHETFQILKKQAEKEFNKKEGELSEKLAKALLEKQELAKEYQSTLEKLQNEYQLKYEKNQQVNQSRQDTLQIQYNDLLKTVDTLKYQIRQEERELRQEILSEKDKSIEALKEELKLLRGTFHSLTDNFQDFRSDLQKTTLTVANNSSLKGKAGEKDLRSLLCQVFGNTQNGMAFSCEESSKESYSADIQMIWQEGKILWESKNYSETVSSKEVKKFHRDMEMNREFSVGVMVSLYSGIAGHSKNGNIDLETLPDGRSIIYISYLFSPESPEPSFTIASLRPFLEVFIQIWKKSIQSQNLLDISHYSEKSDVKEIFDLREKNEIAAIKERQLNLMLSKHLKSLVETKNQYNVWENKLKEMITQIKTSIREHENYTKQMLDILLSNEYSVSNSTGTNDNNFQSSQQDLNVSTQILDTIVFRNRNFEDYDINEQKIIKDVLKIVEICEDNKILAKDFKEYLRENLQWTDKKINELKSKIFQPEIWEAKSKELKHLKFKHDIQSHLLSKVKKQNQLISVINST